ncbi:MAG: hypothetical protein DBX55_09995 [Verrucomicrobia bacterium]|nr:MAG: hypothetical protein DBX55_09995 [Verrucomicrobiota bacterium]
MVVKNICASFCAAKNVAEDCGGADCVKAACGGVSESVAAGKIAANKETSVGKTANGGTSIMRQTLW